MKKIILFQDVWEALQEQKLALEPKKAEKEKRRPQKETEDLWGMEEYDSDDSSASSRDCDLYASDSESPEPSLPGGPEEDEALAGGSGPTPPPWRIECTVDQKNLAMVPPSPEEYSIEVKL